MLHNSTVLTAGDVRRIIKHAKASGLNRHLSELAVRRLNLNPDGLSILSVVIPYHEYRRGPEHHRVNAFLAVRGQEAPEEIPLDVLAEDWDELPETQGMSGEEAHAFYSNPEHLAVAGAGQRRHGRPVLPEEALRSLIRKWISRMNHPQLSKNPQAQHAYEGCIIDVQDLIKETQNV